MTANASSLHGETKAYPTRYPQKVLSIQRFVLVCLAGSTCLLQYHLHSVTTSCCEGKKQELEFFLQGRPHSKKRSTSSGRTPAITGLRANLTTDQISTDNRIDTSNLVIDFLSVGSKLLPEQQAAQQATFGSHPQVRIFYAAQEKDDLDPECHSKLESDEMAKISHFCRKDQPIEDGPHRERRKQRDKKLETVQFPWLFDIQRHFVEQDKLLNKTNPAGWLCAQTRPISALGRLARRYKEDSLAFPDYLFVIDDDTYVNVNRTLKYLAENNPPEQLNVVAGCLYSFRDEFLSMPYGGFGTIFSKTSFERLTRPLFCAHHFAGVDQDAISKNFLEDRKKARKTTLNNYEKFVCLRILENRANEYRFYQDGMNILELFEAYTREQPFRGYSNWIEPGYCFHSDTLIGYIVNTYEVGRHQPRHPVTKVVKFNHFQTYDDSVFYYGWASPRREKTGNRCFHTKFGCKGNDSHICHYISPIRMKHLYESDQE